MQEPNEKLSELLTNSCNLSVGDISALEWIDCNGSEEDEINVSHFTVYNTTTSNNSKKTNIVTGSGENDDIFIPQSSPSNYGKPVVASTATMMNTGDGLTYEQRERGDGDSGEEICGSLDRIDELDEDMETDTFVVALPASSAMKKVESPDNSTYTIEKNLPTVICPTGSGSKENSTYSVYETNQDVDEDTKTILSEISSLELDEDLEKNDNESCAIKHHKDSNNLERNFRDLENVQQLITTLSDRVQNINSVITDIYLEEQKANRVQKHLEETLREIKDNDNDSQETTRNMEVQKITETLMAFLNRLNSNHQQQKSCHCSKEAQTNDTELTKLIELMVPQILTQLKSGSTNLPVVNMSDIDKDIRTMELTTKTATSPSDDSSLSPKLAPLATVDDLIYGDEELYSLLYEDSILEAPVEFRKADSEENIENETRKVGHVNENKEIIKEVDNKNTSRSDSNEQILNNNDSQTSIDEIKINSEIKIVDNNVTNDEIKKNANEYQVSVSNTTSTSNDVILEDVAETITKYGNNFMNHEIIMNNKTPDIGSVSIANTDGCCITIDKQQAKGAESTENNRNITTDNDVTGFHDVAVNNKNHLLIKDNDDYNTKTTVKDRSSSGIENARGALPSSTSASGGDQQQTSSVPEPQDNDQSVVIESSHQSQQQQPLMQLTCCDKCSFGHNRQRKIKKHIENVKKFFASQQNNLCEDDYSEVKKTLEQLIESGDNIMEIDTQTVPSNDNNHGNSCNRYYDEDGNGSVTNTIISTKDELVTAKSNLTGEIYCSLQCFGIPANVASHAFIIRRTNSPDHYNCPIVVTPKITEMVKSECSNNAIQILSTTGECNNNNSNALPQTKTDAVDSGVGVVWGQDAKISSRIHQAVNDSATVTSSDNLISNATKENFNIFKSNDDNENVVDEIANSNGGESIFIKSTSSSVWNTTEQRFESVNDESTGSGSTAVASTEVVQTSIENVVSSLPTSGGAPSPPAAQALHAPSPSTAAVTAPQTHIVDTVTNSSTPHVHSLNTSTATCRTVNKNPTLLTSSGEDFVKNLDGNQSESVLSTTRNQSKESDHRRDVINNSDSSFVWQFVNGRLVFKKLESDHKSDSKNEEDKLTSETESVEGKNSSRTVSATIRESDAAVIKQQNNSGSSDDVTTYSLFDAIEKYADRIESEIAKCSRETNELNQIIENKNNTSASVSATTQNPHNNNVQNGILSSRDLNKGVFDGHVRLKRLENKLKQAAGLIPTATTSGDNSESVNCCTINTTDATNDKERIVISGVDQSSSVENQSSVVVSDNGVLPSAAANNFFNSKCCEFDVSKVADFGSGCYPESDFYVVYDELEDDDNGSSTSSCCSEEHYHLINCATNLTASTMRGDTGNELGSGDQQSQQRGSIVKRHNPDHENLKSLLKKPSGKGKNSEKKNNRVVFNEKRNEFFDADYIILIREDCDYDEEDDDSVCTCNQHEMVRLTCCEPNCNCNSYESGDYEQTPPSPKFAPPLEFVDAVTLSPPEGYKDMDLGEQQIAALQQLARQRAQIQGAVCRDCSSAAAIAQHHQPLSDDSDSAHSENEEEEIIKCSSGSSSDQHERATGEISKTDQSQQTTPTTPTTPPSEDSPTQSQQRYILETITMTTVTERRIMREADGGEEEGDAGDDGDNEGNHKCDDESATRKPLPVPLSGSPISGILKGGKLWNKQQTENKHNTEVPRSQVTVIETTFSADSDEITNRRSVRFCDSDEEKRNSGDEEVSQLNEESMKNENMESKEQNDNEKNNETDSCNNSLSPDGTEMLLTFKLGNHLLISNNSLRPNSAVRQLFPCANPLTPNDKIDVDSGQQYLITSDSLRAFEETKRSKLPPLLQNSEINDETTIRKTIERNTLRRSLIRYEPRSKKQPKTDNSLVERIKQLTCDVDDNPPPQENEQQSQTEETEENMSSVIRASPPGEEARKSPEVNTMNHKNIDKNSFSPSSSSTTSSNSSMSSTYKKITDLFAKKDKTTTHVQAETQTSADITANTRHNTHSVAPDLGNGKVANSEFIEPQCAVSKYNVTHEARKQFLSTLAPLTACVGGTHSGNHDEYYYQLSSQGGERTSVASTVGTEYSLEDIDAVLQTENNEEGKSVAPDVLVGTPSASESGDELAMFVQQDASRIERIKKRYQSEANDEDDEHDDYGFNRRPSVRGIKPRFGSTNEILQQIQSQLQPVATQTSAQQPAPPMQPSSQPRPGAPVAWPYYSEANINNIDNKNIRPPPHLVGNRVAVKKDEAGNEYTQNIPPENKYTYAQTYHYIQDTRYRAPPYRPTTLLDENMYQTCTNQRCTNQHYTLAHHHTAPIMRIGGGCAELYQTLPTRRTTRPESPPPMEVARNYHQTMVLIPYNHIEGYHPGILSPNPHYSSAEQVNNYNRIASNKIKSPQPPHIIRQPQDTHMNYQCNTNTMLKNAPKQMIRVPYSSGNPVQVHLMTSRSESPQLSGQFATARGTQTAPMPPMSQQNYYSTQNPRYRPAIGPVNSNIWQNQDQYVTKAVRHSGMYSVRPMSEGMIDAQMNGYRNSEGLYSMPRESAPTSPTKSKITSERGVPEGAASVSPQDSYQNQQNNSNNVMSPTNPQANAKPMYYAMNV